MNQQPQMQPQQQEPEVNIHLKVSQINLVIAGLEELPHKYSRPVIDNISQQAQSQLQRSVPEGPLSDKVVQ